MAPRTGWGREGAVLVGASRSCPAIAVLKVTHKGTARGDAGMRPLPWPLTVSYNSALLS